MSRTRAEERAPSVAGRPTPATRHSRYLPLVGVLLLAGVWRLVVAYELPALSRDGVTFCWYARELGVQGPAYLKTPAAQQHPLFPVLILAAQRVFSAGGAPDTPATWQRSGQLVAWLGGMAVVVLAGILTRRLVRVLALPISANVAVPFAMLMATWLDHNIWLSADVMADQVHLAFYLAAVCLLLDLRSAGSAALCGLLSGFAFLTRQEGLLPAVAGLMVLAALARRGAWRPVAVRALALVVALLLCVGPYWLYVGRFSTKKDPRDVVGMEVAALRSVDALGAEVARARPGALSAEGERQFSLAKLKTIEPRWYQLLPYALYQVLRAGRVVVPVLAILPLINLRRRLLTPPLLGPLTCLVGHFALGLLLLNRYGYLDARHMLVVVMLLAPFATLLVARIVQLLWSAGHKVPATIAFVVLLGPLALYAWRIPNTKDRFLVEAARWLSAHDAAIQAKRLLGGSSTRRIAFYCAMGWQQWYERPQDYAELCGQIRANGPGYFAIELEDPGRPERHFERQGNRALVQKLLSDEAFATRLEPVHAVPGPDGSELVLIEVRDTGP